MSANNRKLKVFLCHASEDKPAVRELYQRLNTEAWIDSWLDEESLLPGQDWDVEIYKATRDADAIIIALSERSVQKEGYVNKEIRRVLDIANEKPEGTIYIIPLRLDDCTPSFAQLRKLHWLDYFTPNVHQKLLRSLRIRAEFLRISIRKRVSRIAELEDTEKKPDLKKTSVVKKASSSSPDLYIPPEFASEDFLPPPAGVPSWQFGEMEFVKVPHGEFLMGSTDKDNDTYNDEKPQHKLNIRYDFLMARFPVTNTLFMTFNRETDYRTKAELDGVAHVWNGKEWTKIKGASWYHPLGTNSDIAGKGNHPVVQIFWKDAVAFCDWANFKYGATLPRGLVFRLPTEAEWEKAARGKEGLVFPWGNEFDANNCNWRESGWDGTSPVGVYSLQGDSPFGCADMSGNVWEWTTSLWGKNAREPAYLYPYNPRDGRENQKVGDDALRVLRGGSFYGTSRYLRAAARSGYNFVDYHYGFRIALAPKLS
ncbi:MAG: SUMF1/EgtB/PvdO family nonheme iron enzyme [Anaerolineae bacterium]|jgi:formylglycine-generating enzyme required for sulfatase activity|nr:SUMF1/EgtB/PvdO family nonheme iron enzyme [Anaerolineae bacterium]MBT7071272.1 SUMF1/EgtB/PvdO family nonheme iron enzyme [Anaerolineae bacterium]MBT7325896.1 SUMF1/EgtB/PvdO family nonheme iron enzyme [Anaerolineae bacterium]